MTSSSSPLSGQPELPDAAYTVGSEPRCFALVPCAGTGSRAGSFNPKQYEPVAGLPLVAHTLAALARVPRITATLVVLAADDEQFEEDLPGVAGESVWLAKVGGASRAETVANGLAALREHGAQPHDWVLVHDAARCLIRPEAVERLISACWGDEVGGLLALPVADTLKSEQDGRATATVDRAGKWAAQTPQMFRLGLLAPALAQALSSDPGAVTDEASAVELLGHQPRLVRGDYENIKVTWPGDFALAERLLVSQNKGTELRPQLPATDFALAQRFYQDIGFTREFVHGELAGFVWGARAGFLLQGGAAAARAGAAWPQMHLTVDDLDTFWARLQANEVEERYGLVLEAPQQRPWGLKEMRLTDPTGVPWRVTQRLEVSE